MPRLKNPNPTRQIAAALTTQENVSVAESDELSPQVSPRQHHDLIFHEQLMTSEYDVEVIDDCRKRPSATDWRRMDAITHHDTGDEPIPLPIPLPSKNLPIASPTGNKHHPQIVSWIKHRLTMKTGAKMSASDVVRLYDDDHKHHHNPAPLRNYQVGQLLRRIFPDLQRCKITVDGKRTWVYRNLDIVDTANHHQPSLIAKDIRQSYMKKTKRTNGNYLKFHDVSEPTSVGACKLISDGNSKRESDLKELLEKRKVIQVTPRNRQAINQSKSKRVLASENVTLYKLLNSNNNSDNNHSVTSRAASKQPVTSSSAAHVTSIASKAVVVKPMVKTTTQSQQSAEHIVQWLKDNYEYCEGYHVRSLDVLRKYNQVHSAEIKYLSHVGRIIKSVFPRARHIRRSFKGGRREWVYQNIRSCGEINPTPTSRSRSPVDDLPTLVKRPSAYTSLTQLSRPSSLKPVQRSITIKRPPGTSWLVGKPLTGLSAHRNNNNGHDAKRIKTEPPQHDASFQPISERRAISALATCRTLASSGGGSSFKLVEEAGSPSPPDDQTSASVNGSKSDDGGTVVAKRHDTMVEVIYDHHDYAAKPPDDDHVTRLRKTKGTAPTAERKASDEESMMTYRALTSSTLFDPFPYDPFKNLVDSDLRIRGFQLHRESTSAADEGNPPVVADVVNRRGSDARDDARETANSRVVNGDPAYSGDDDTNHDVTGAFVEVDAVADDVGKLRFDDLKSYSAREYGWSLTPNLPAANCRPRNFVEWVAFDGQSVCGGSRVFRELKIYADWRVEVHALGRRIFHAGVTSTLEPTHSGVVKMLRKLSEARVCRGIPAYRFSDVTSAANGDVIAKTEVWSSRDDDREELRHRATCCQILYDGQEKSCVKCLQLAYTSGNRRDTS